jgi:hypothetical protein
MIKIMVELIEAVRDYRAEDWADIIVGALIMGMLLAVIIVWSAVLS